MWVCFFIAEYIWLRLPIVTAQSFLRKFQLMKISNNVNSFSSLCGVGNFWKFKNTRCITHLWSVQFIVGFMYSSYTRLDHASVEMFTMPRISAKASIIKILCNFGMSFTSWLTAVFHGTSSWWSQHTIISWKYLFSTVPKRKPPPTT